MLNKNKIIKSYLAILRLFTQVFFTIVFFTLFWKGFCAIKKILLFLTSGEKDIGNILPEILILISIIFITFISRRIFCGWMCSFGTITEIIHDLAQKVIRKKVNIEDRTDKILRKVKYLIFITVFVFWLLRFDEMNSYDLWNAFGNLTHIGDMINEIPYAFTLLGIIILLGVFVERFFCKYLCPFGAIQSLFSFFSISRVVRKTPDCNNCSICNTKCRMGIKISDKPINYNECISCFRCIHSCPGKKAHIKLVNKPQKVGLIVVSSIIILIATSFINKLIVGSITKKEVMVHTQESNKKEPHTTLTNKPYNSTPNNTMSNNDKTSNNGTIPDNDKADLKEGIKDEKSSVKVNSLYKDGEFIGVNKSLKVKVTIESDEIKNIQILSHNEAKEFLDKVLRVIPKMIFKQQTVHVDVVSGATNTSSRFLKAIEDALNKARI